MRDILVLYYSSNGATKTLAREVCRGVDSVKGMSARLRTVPPVSPENIATKSLVPESGPTYALTEDLAECAGMILGSPTRFGNMSSSLKYFIDSTSTDWIKGSLTGKPAGVFTSTSSLHGGSESTLLTMAIPLLHHGMLYVGVPYSEKALSTTRTGGSPYGASHVTWNKNPDSLSNEEKSIAFALGKRVSEIAKKLET
tara:strand:+ start:89 stop:682 length:594 start_codon:yes stop_codon:yes gene_type:complete